MIMHTLAKSWVGKAPSTCRSFQWFRLSEKYDEPPAHWAYRYLNKGNTLDFLTPALEIHFTFLFPQIFNSDPWIQDHPEWEVKNDAVYFQKAKETAPCKEIPSLQLINQTLSYARELERIV